MIDTVALREKVLDLAIRGKLVPQDPNDEPASVLLERIRAQKQQMVKDGKLKAKDIKDDSIIFVGEDNLHYEKFADGTVKCIEDEIPFELPESWAWARIVSISEEIFAGGDKPEKFSKEQNSECQYAIYSNGVENDGLYGFTDIPRVVKPSITVSGRGTIGFSCVRCAPFFPIIRLITITPSSLISLKFLDFVFKRLLETGTGSSIPQLTVPMVKPKLIPIPPIKEQEKIVFTAEGFLEQIKIIDEQSVDLFETISLIKSKILELAIRGKLVPQNPDDEPATMLLERIRAEKEELIKQGKIKRDKKESVIFKGEDNSYYDIIIPSNWTWSSISDVSISIADGSHNPPPNRNQGVPLLSAVNIFDNAVNYHLATRWITHQEWEIENKRTKIDIGDVLLTIVGTIGRTAIVKDHQHFALQRSVAVIKPCLINSEYLMFVLQSPTIYEWLIDNAKGNAQLGIYLKDLSKLIVPLPPIQEQRRLVRAIKTLFAQLDTILCSLS